MTPYARHHFRHCRTCAPCLRRETELGGFPDEDMSAVAAGAFRIIGDIKPNE
jgi:hypothetical protein